MAVLNNDRGLVIVALTFGDFFMGSVVALQKNGENEFSGAEAG